MSKPMLEKNKVICTTIPPDVEKKYREEATKIDRTVAYLYRQAIMQRFTRRK